MRKQFVKLMVILGSLIVLLFIWHYSVQFSSISQSCPTLCDTMDCSRPGFPVHHQLEELAMIFVFWMLSFKPAFSFSSFTFIKRLFSSSLLFAIMVLSFAYLRLLIFLPAILIPACASSSLAFHMMYSAYKLNKQGDNMQPWFVLCLIIQSYPILCDPMDCSLPGFSVHGDSPGKNTGVGCHALL